MADKDQNDELMSEINSISKEMGNNFATMFKGMMVLMFKDVTQGRADTVRLVNNAETNINTKLKSMQAEVKKDMSDFADGMRKEAGDTAQATLDGARASSAETDRKQTKAVDGKIAALNNKLDATLQSQNSAADAKQAQWQLDNQEFIKNEISQHVRHYAGQEKRIRALEGRKAK